GRNLIVCIDGTSNPFGDKNTNVVELYSQLVKDDGIQLIYYNNGIGTYPNHSWKSWSHLKQVVYNTIDLAVAWSVEKIVMSAYRWLVDNYQDGDRIYLFGFSRGAYQVRALAEMIHKVGLVCKGNEEQIPLFYSLFERTSQTPSPTIPLDLARRFEDTFSRKDVRVHFIGVWDTLSSIEIGRGPNLPGTVNLDHACYFRHAMTLDERRVKPPPEYTREGVMVDESKQLPQNAPDIKEVWFPRTHSDIGNVVNGDLDHKHSAFSWMSYEATWAGLKLQRGNAEWKQDELGSVGESLTLSRKFLEHVLLKRPSYEAAQSTVWYY
ncbi:hypothetical protein BU17DRAFT_56311, partial [Hysterangium stoloniferum]